MNVTRLGGPEAVNLLGALSDRPRIGGELAARLFKRSPAYAAGACEAGDPRGDSAACTAERTRPRNSGSDAAAAASRRIRGTADRTAHAARAAAGAARDRAAG